MGDQDLELSELEEETQSEDTSPDEASEGMIEQDTSKAKMIFNTSLLTYEGDDSWVEEALFEIKDCLNKTICPDHAVTGFGASLSKITASAAA